MRKWKHRKVKWEVKIPCWRRSEKGEIIFNLVVCPQQSMNHLKGSKWSSCWRLSSHLPGPPLLPLKGWAAGQALLQDSGGNVLNELSAPGGPPFPTLWAGWAGDPGRIGAKGLIHHKETFYFGQAARADAWCLHISVAAYKGGCHTGPLTPSAPQKWQDRDRCRLVDVDMLETAKLTCWHNLAS